MVISQDWTPSPIELGNISTVKWSGGVAPYSYVVKNSGGTTVKSDNDIYVTTLDSDPSWTAGTYTITITDHAGATVDSVLSINDVAVDPVAISTTLISGTATVDAYTNRTQTVHMVAGNTAEINTVRLDKNTGAVVGGMGNGCTFTPNTTPEVDITYVSGQHHTITAKQAGTVNVMLRSGDTTTTTTVTFIISPAPAPTLEWDVPPPATADKSQTITASWKGGTADYHAEVKSGVEIINIQTSDETDMDMEADLTLPTVAVGPLIWTITDNSNPMQTLTFTTDVQAVSTAPVITVTDADGKITETGGIYSVDLVVGDTLTLVPDATPAGTADGWRYGSSGQTNDAVFTINATTGLITAKGAGTATAIIVARKGGADVAPPLRLNVVVNVTAAP